MNIGTREIIIIVACILAACIAVSAIVGFFLYQTVEREVSFDASNLYWDVGDCVIGSKGSIRMFGTEMNVTVQGETVYRDRETCHSNGTSVVDGEPYYFDLYRSDGDDSCLILRPVSGDGESAEECDGNWEGYASER